METEQITPAEALLWLAGLETNCPAVSGYDLAHILNTNSMDCEYCHGTNMVPVLDLREPCPLLDEYPRWPSLQTAHQLQGINCECQGRKWIPKRGEMALHQAMHKDGWRLDIGWQSERTGGHRSVVFTSDDGFGIQGGDANDFLAAAKAMKAQRLRIRVQTGGESSGKSIFPGPAVVGEREIGLAAVTRAHWLRWAKKGGQHAK